MPVRTECPPPAGASAASAASLIPPPPINTQQPGVATSLLYSGSKFRGHQKSKGNSYDVEVVLQVSAGPGRAGARGPSRGAHGPCRPSAPRARSCGSGPHCRGLLHRRLPPGTCPAGVSHSRSPIPDLALGPGACSARLPADPEYCSRLETPDRSARDPEALLPMTGRALAWVRSPQNLSPLQQFSHQSLPLRPRRILHWFLQTRDPPCDWVRFTFFQT